MPLDKAGLITNLTSAYNQAKNNELTEAQFAELIADAMDVFVKTGSVLVTGVTSGGATAPGTIT